MQIRVGSRGNVKVYSRWVLQFIVTQVIFLGSTLTDERERVGGVYCGRLDGHTRCRRYDATSKVTATYIWEHRFYVRRSLMP